MVSNNDSWAVEAGLPSERREGREDMIILSLALPIPISLSAMSVIAVFAFCAATRRGRAAMTGRYGAKSRPVNRESWAGGRVVVD